MIVLGTICVLVVLLMIGVPIVFTFGAATLFIALAGDYNMATLLPAGYNRMNNMVLVAVPLFIFMAQILDASGIAARLFETMHIVMGRIRGGLGIAVILASTVFAATAGVVGATEVSIGLLAIPALMKVRYNIPLIAGTRIFNL